MPVSNRVSPIFHQDRHWAFRLAFFEELTGECCMNLLVDLLDRLKAECFINCKFRLFFLLELNIGNHVFDN